MAPTLQQGVQAIRDKFAKIGLDEARVTAFEQQLSGNLNSLSAASTEAEVQAAMGDIDGTIEEVSNFLDETVKGMSVWQSIGAKATGTEIPNREEIEAQVRDGLGPIINEYATKIQTEDLQQKTTQELAQKEAERKAQQEALQRAAAAEAERNGASPDAGEGNWVDKGPLQAIIGAVIGFVSGNTELIEKSMAALGRFFTGEETPPTPKIDKAPASELDKEGYDRQLDGIGDELKKIAGGADKNSDGKANGHEAAAYLRETLNQRDDLSPKQKEALRRTADIFEQAGSDLALTPAGVNASVAAMKADFEAADADKSGGVSKREFDNILQGEDSIFQSIARLAVQNEQSAEKTPTPVPSVKVPETPAPSFPY